MFKNNIKQLIFERKIRLSNLMVLSGFEYLSGQRGKLANVSKANKDNEDTDKQLLKIFPEQLPF